MAETTISWTSRRMPDGRIVPGYTFNPWIGCTKVSPACDGCYAENLMANRYKRVVWGGQRQRTSIGNWQLPLRWNRVAEAEGTRPFVFCASLADVFDNRVPPEWRRDLFDLIRATPRLIWRLLTKRPQNIAKMAAAAGGLPANVALGTTCEDQTRWDINVPHLIYAKRLLRPLFVFVSAEPLLGPIYPYSAPIIPALAPLFARSFSTFDPINIEQFPDLRIDEIITGGETDQGKHKARPSNPQWFRQLRDDCAAEGVIFHHKQNGEWVSVSEVAGDGPHFTFPDGRTVRRIGAKLAGRTIDGVIHDATPEVGL